jgi:hypothetical protein
MITQLIAKCRYLLQDSSATDSEVYTASGRTFVIAQENASAVNSVIVNGTTLATSLYTYDISSQTVTINVGSVVTGDAVVVNYTYTKYSIAELTDYIKSALIYLSDYNYDTVFEVASGDEDIYPIPNKKEQNLIVTIVGILINPDWSSYRTSSVTVNYPSKLTKEEKIEKLIARFKRCGVGISGILEINGESYGL